MFCIFEQRRLDAFRDDGVRLHSHRSRLYRRRLSKTTMRLMTCNEQISFVQCSTRPRPDFFSPGHHSLQQFFFSLDEKTRRRLRRVRFFPNPNSWLLPSLKALETVSAAFCTPKAREDDLAKLFLGCLFFSPPLFFFFFARRSSLRRR
jgi:hypothetical protein